MTKNNRRIVFHRNYHGYTGGHQKVRDYIDHFVSLGWQTQLYVSNKAATNKALFSNISGVSYQADYNLHDQDVAFLAGEDWNAYLTETDMQVRHPVINLIQHVRHAEPGTSLFSYLKYPALRLCVSQAVKRAIEPFANGPCVVIPMGHDLPDISRNYQNDVFILANKNPELGQQLYQWLTDAGKTVHIYSQTVERELVSKAMAASSVTIALPNHTEGFYLPGIEAMWLSKAAVVPFCVANSEYNTALNNCYLCEYTTEDIKKMTLKALNAGRIEAWARQYFGKRTARKFTKPRELAALDSTLKKYLPEYV